MCRFSVSQQPVVETDHDCDDFNWFDAIDEYDCSEHEEEPQGQPENGTLLDLWCQQISSELPAGSSALTEVMPVPQQTPEQFSYAQQDVWATNIQRYQPVAAQPVVSSASLQDGLLEEREMASAGSSDSLMHQSNNAVTSKHASSKKGTGKAHAVLDEAAKLERVKQKRRESAQRSRARKNAYMKELEAENAALKQQIDNLQKMVAQLQSCMTAMPEVDSTNMRNPFLVGNMLPMQC